MVTGIGCREIQMSLHVHAWLRNFGQDTWPFLPQRGIAKSGDCRTPVVLGWLVAPPPGAPATARLDDGTADEAGMPLRGASVAAGHY
jgi:hypothetical protein